ncbi:MAG: hypothetical protein AAFU78_13035 [Cyanobacteria bacterium J06633_2]
MTCVLKRHHTDKGFWHPSAGHLNPPSYTVIDMIHSQLVPTAKLSAGDRAEMFHLLQQHFAGVRIDVFQSDLREKNWVLLLRDHAETLKGFSTLSFYSTEFNGESIDVVYSGDTIMDPSAWSSLSLAKSWISAVTTLKALHSTGRLYWFLISSGYRTYRFLPTFWETFYPCYNNPTPLVMQDLMHRLAEEKFGDRYHRSIGIVRLDHPHQLKGDLSGIPEERLSDAHIHFFAQKNPRHALGDELVCLAEICEDNLTRAGHRMWQSIASTRH